MRSTVTIPGRRASFLAGMVALLATTSAGARSATPPQDDSAGAGCAFRFVDVAAEAGITFVHDAGASAGRHLPETMGAGAAWLDWDGDGWLDLYLVQSGPFPPGPVAPTGDRLFRNLGPGPDGVPRFVDVSGRALGESRGYGQGVLAADLDGDGDADLVRSAWGGEDWFENRRGRFVRHELPPGDDEEGEPWGSSLAAVDVDVDGDVDLFVTRYLSYDPEADLFCGDADTGERTYCDPSLFPGQRDVLWRNEGGGRFVRATAESGLRLADGEVVGRGLGALFVDVDGDLLADLYVANDITPNNLFLNGASGFRDESLLSGTAVNAEGRAEAGMGLATVDDDRDGDPDLLVTNFDVETNTLYRNRGDGFFEDRSAPTGFGLPSFNLLGFGLVAEDLDLDGRVDVYVGNGHIFPDPARENVGYRQPDLVLRGGSAGFVEEPCATAGLPLRVSRGVAAGDVDLDGDVDLLVTHVDEAPGLLLAEVSGGPGARPWLGVAPLPGGPTLAGAVVALEGVAGGSDVRWPHLGGSYLSSGDATLRFALPQPASREADDAQGVRRLVLRRPGAARLRIDDPPSGRVLRIGRPTTMPALAAGAVEDP